MRLPVWKRKSMMADAAAAEHAAEQAVEAGNPACRTRFCELFDRYQPALRRLVAAYVANPADREDLLQEIAVGVWRSLPAFRGDASERTWIYRVAHNISIRNSSQVRRRNSREPLLDTSTDRPSSESSAEQALMLAERRSLLMEGIRELALADRQLITLHLEGLTPGEIEEVTGLSQGAVATRLARIRQRLAKWVQAEGVPHE